MHDSKPIKDIVKLSKRQIDILQQIADGKTEKAIAIEMNLKVETIKYHKKKILKALDACSSAEVVKKAISLGLIAIQE